MTIRRLLVAVTLIAVIAAGRLMAAVKLSQITFERANAEVTVTGSDGVRWMYDYLSLDSAMGAYLIGGEPGVDGKVSWVVDEAGGDDADYLAVDLGFAIDSGKSGTKVQVESIESVTVAGEACRRLELRDFEAFDLCDSKVPEGLPTPAAALAVLQAASMQPDRATLHDNGDGTTQVRFQLVNRKEP